jgi:hypothetical protein
VAEAERRDVVRRVMRRILKFDEWFGMSWTVRYGDRLKKSEEELLVCCWISIPVNFGLKP